MEETRCEGQNFSEVLVPHEEEEEVVVVVVAAAAVVVVVVVLVTCKGNVRDISVLVFCTVHCAFD